MAKMKGPDFKAILLNHGEKVGAVLVGLLGLTSLATANWSSCDKDPNQLKMDADATERQWLSSSWPEDQKKAFSDTPDVQAMAKKMLDSNDEFGRYATTRRWNEPINKVQEKLATAVVLPPESPEATLVIFPNVKKDDPAEAEETLVADATDPKKLKGKTEEDTQDLENLFGANAAAQPGVGDQYSGGNSDLPGGIGGPGGKGGLAPGGLGTPSSSGLPSSGPPGGAGGRRGKGGGGLAGPGMGGAPGMGGPGMGGPGMGGPGMGMGPGMGLGMGGMGLGMGGGMSEDGYGGGFGLDVVEEKKVRSQAGVSVRYVFDIYRESEMLAEALNIDPAQASQRVDFVNLQIERQRAQPGEDQWTGPWEPLPLKDIAQILEESLAYDIEIVNPGVVRSEITMPLPRRAAGKWTPADASHKRLENYQLSEREREIIDRLQAKLREEADKQKAMLPPEQAANEGFRKYSFSTNDLAMGMGGMGGMGGIGMEGGMGMGSMGMAGMPGMRGMSGQGMGAGGDQYNSMLDDLYSELTEGDSEKEGEEAKDQNGNPMNAKDREEFRKQMRNALAGGRLLLVRFMDFTCDRGTAYRYRVRLEMKNPNFNKPIDELVDPETAKNKTVFSPWSDPTEPVFVPDAYRYFPEKAESRPRADEYATMAMYYEHETAGTPVMAPVRVPVGTRIGGKQSVELVDLGKNTLELTEIELKSRDFLASVTESPKVNANDLPELKDFLRGLSGTKAVGDRLTVIDSNGAIVSRYGADKVSIGEREISKADDARLTAFVLKAYEHLRPAKEGETNDPYGGADGLSGAGDMGGMGGMGPGTGGGMSYGGGMGRGSSMTGSGGSRGRRGGRGAGMPGMGGMGGPAGK